MWNNSCRRHDSRVRITAWAVYEWESLLSVFNVDCPGALTNMSAGMAIQP